MPRLSVGGMTLKLLQTVLYALAFGCSGLILALYAYFLAVLSIDDLHIDTWLKAVTGMSGAAVLYTVFAVLLTCCLGGKMFFAFLAIVFDVVFCAAFIAIAVLTRDGADSCTGFVKSPLGDGDSRSREELGREKQLPITLGTACRMNTAVFAVAIIGAFIFAINGFVQLWIGRHHQREKRFGPSPANGYTSGSAGSVPFWRRRRVKTTAVRDAEMSPASAGLRPSHDTAFTGSTVAAPATATYDSTGKPVVSGPVGGGLNPYHDHTRATNF